ncbi:unnamed protein product [Rhizophagus irregularis]|nr:unnamed protein product [Rhizophagus irregularis]CAB5377813.1 unnamed protein product [Rhizophagus irregularis]
MALDFAIVPNEPYVPKSTVPYPDLPLSDANNNSRVRKSSISPRLDGQMSIVVAGSLHPHKLNSAKDAQGQKCRAMTARLWTQGVGYREPAEYIPTAPVGINPGANFTIDLYYIQQEVLMSQRIDS